MTDIKTERQLNIFCLLLQIMGAVGGLDTAK
jgi:hypothetical protein